MDNYQVQKDIYLNTSNNLKIQSDLTGKTVS